MAMISNHFSGDLPISCAEGRRGEIIISQAGVPPVRWDGQGEAVTAGISAPPMRPSLLPGQDPAIAYYIARTDVSKPGAVYYSPPGVAFQFDCADPEPWFRPAAGIAYLEKSGVAEIDTQDGGKYYPCEPTVVLSDTHGKGAVLRAIPDSPETYVSDASNSPETGLTGYAMVSDGPPWPDEQALPADMSRAVYAIWEYVDIPLSGNGIQRVTGPRRWFSVANPCGGVLPPQYYIEMQTDVEVVGFTEGSGAIARVYGSGHQYLGADCICSGQFTASCFFQFRYTTAFGGAAPYKMGKDYDKDAEIAIIIPAVSVFDQDTGTMVAYDFNAANTKVTNAKHWQKAIILRVYSGEDPRNPGGGIGYPIKDVVIEDGGSGYLVAPQLKIVSSNGFGAYATCTVSNGAIDSVVLENGGGGYKTRPEIKVLSGGAEAFAVSRPHMRGLYQCYYRFTDSTPEERGGPVPSNLSPVHEFDAGEGMASVTWSLLHPENSRVTHVELWRSTSGQATTVYKVARVLIAPFNGETITYVDDWTDEELRDPDRNGYAAMPIVLPNGELNAMRFVPPPSDKAVVVRFQDRMWYGVEGANPNAIYYSEIDEPESVPAENELIIQQNARDYDSITAMIPFGSTLYLAQSRRTFSLSFSQIPALDGQITPAAYRGCLSQRCWQIHEGYAYMADRYGLYRMNASGAVEDLSESVRDQFENGIDFGRVTWAFLALDNATKTLRFFIVHREDGASEFPTRALCLDIASGALWWEKYPQAITSSTIARMANGDVATIYGASGGVYAIDAGPFDRARGSIVDTLVTARGRGYKTPPQVTALGGFGARLQASINQDGEVNGIWILEPGFGYESGALIIDPPNDPSSPESAKVQAVAFYNATPNDIDTNLWPTFHFKTGCVEYPSDMDGKDGGAEQRRDLRLYYKPTTSSCEVSMRMYYNNSPHPRINVAERDRGAGFVDSTVDPAARVDLGYFTDRYGQDTGAARAIRTGKTLEDVRSGDRDVAVQVCGPSRGEAVLFYAIDVFGGAQ
jgi:hypothetical protein